MESNSTRHGVLGSEAHLCSHHTSHSATYDWVEFNLVMSQRRELNWSRANPIIKTDARERRVHVA